MDGRILVVGAGAVGAYVGGNLQHLGYDITLADPWPEHVDAINRDGLRLEGMSDAECFTARPRALHITQMQSLIREEPYQVVLMSMKSYDTDWAAHLGALYLADDGCMVSLQNGINEARVAAVVGAHRTLGCVASKIVVEVLEPAHVVRRVPKGGAAHTVFRIGEMDGEIRPRTQWLAEAFGKIDSAKASDNLAGERWSKLVQNAMGNCVAAATGQTNKQNSTAAKARRTTIRLAGEAILVGEKLGHQLELINGLDPAEWVDAAQALIDRENDAPALRKIEDRMIASAAKMADGARPSMAQDVAKGRRTEIFELNGLVVERGREVGIDTPVNAAMCVAVDRIDRGKASPSLDLLPDMV